MEYHIDQLCKGIPECDSLGQDAIKAGTAMCKACADNSQPGVCPSAPAPPPATTGGNKPPPPRTTPPANTCAARGGVMVDQWDYDRGGNKRVCFTLKGANDGIEDLRKRLVLLIAIIGQHLQDGTPVPPTVKDEVTGNTATLESIRKGLTSVNADLARYALDVEQKYRELGEEIRKLATRVTNLEGEVVAVKRDVNDLKSRSPVVIPPQTSSAVSNRTFGFSLSAYWGADTFKQYGEFQQSPGLEVGMYHRLGSVNILGQHDYYVQLFAGGGQPGASSYGGQSMYEWHAGGGFLHNGKVFGLGYGGEFLQRRTTSHHDVRSTFVGGYVEPRINIYEGLFFSVRVGLGSRHAQGQTQDRTTDRFDVPVQVGLGYQVFSW